MSGDVNGDGFDDVIVGAPYGDDGGSRAGEAYVIFGKAEGFGTVDLGNLGTAGFIIQGDTAGDLAAGASPRQAISTATALTISSSAHPFQ